jgi:AAA15 family ATPase/GTPase
MIQEIKIKNFLSYRDEVVLSFVASDDAFAEDSQIVIMNDTARTRLLRIGLVYGYNASGKSNLLKAFSFLHSFWTNEEASADKGTYVRPFRLNASAVNEPTRFELTFFVEDTKYVYLLELDSKQVLLEQLSYEDDTTQLVLLFRREMRDGQSAIEFNNQHGDPVTDIVKDKITVECLKNMSFFVARDKANAHLPKIDAAGAWMRNQVLPMISPQTDLTGYAKKMIVDNQALVGHLLNFLRAADFNITNITTDVIKEHVSDEVMQWLVDGVSMPSSERTRLLTEKTLERLKTTFEHTVESETQNASYVFATSEESWGTLKTFGIETALYQVVQASAFLPIDEIENSLHPLLLEKILFDYLRTPARSQILIATHNDGLMDLVGDLLRRDSIWLTEKDKSGTTDLYKLTDFKGVNQLASLREAYRNRRFGATMGYGK